VLDRKFVYDGWQVVLELDGTDSDAVVRKFTWGPDISGLMGGAASGSFDSAGGIGGLLAVSTGTTDEDYLYMYDANGNVGQLIAWANDYGNASGTAWHDDRIVAAYEYDAYGDVDTASGNYEGDNPFRFSRKWFDDESALGYWGYRYFSARLGRWLTRDPVEETGGDLLYAYVLNDPTNDIDSFGLQTSQPTSPRSRRASSTPASRPATRPSTRASALRSPNSRRSARPRK
jgi:RHS repeat-associated protein